MDSYETRFRDRSRPQDGTFVIYTVCYSMLEVLNKLILKIASVFFAIWRDIQKVTFSQGLNCYFLLHSLHQYTITVISTITSYASSRREQSKKGPKIRTPMIYFNSSCDSIGVCEVTKTTGLISLYCLSLQVNQ